jgi:hypothetical protein
LAAPYSDVEHFFFIKSKGGFELAEGHQVPQGVVSSLRTLLVKFSKGTLLELTTSHPTPYIPYP